ncbi:hypothetical protein KCTC32516_00138 [Polaribacter huanghezhanensis]|uniref:hypothetical protein n=1 Tax=Polaribacter huanghezhanensis TaxID=1354726 RepID=UPI0026490F28|nr:hypothetical protein [Polaribacter huanghezhanensis]WKD84804.1 hypothetical protein KCTC32516_00138 [Polaribacter huanghezhanensis]
MTKYLHFFGLALLIVCCSFTKGNTHTNTTKKEHNEVSFFKEKASSSVESTFFKAIQVAEITINQLGANTFTFSSEESTVKPFTTNKGLEQFIEFQFLQYVNTEKNFLFLSRKSDLIFPFHYHW